METIQQERGVCSGCHKLVDELDRAVAGNEGPGAITRAVQQLMIRLIASGEVELPEALMRPSADGYARRLIHHNRELDYTVLAMVWGVGQGTPIHDHSGLWCVEGVIDGQIEVTQYALTEKKGSLYRFQPQGQIGAGVGTSGSLIPPFEYHTIANALDDRPSVTVHVYGGEMEQCSIFHHRSDDWYEVSLRTLALTA